MTLYLTIQTQPSSTMPEGEGLYESFRAHLQNKARTDWNLQRAILSDDPCDWRSHLQPLEQKTTSRSMGTPDVSIVLNGGDVMQRQCT